MNTVKDFTIGQRVSTDLGDGTVTKIGRIYVYVDIDGSDKTEKLTPADLRDLPSADEIPVVDEAPVNTGGGESDVFQILAAQLDNGAPADNRPPMRIKGKRNDSGTRKAARKAQRRSRRANRSR